MTDEQMDRIDGQFRQLHDRFGQIRQHMDQRFEHVDRRFEQVDRRFEQIDRRFEHADRRFEQTDGALQKLGVLFEDQQQKLKMIAEAIQIGRDVAAAENAAIRKSVAEQIAPIRALLENHEKQLTALASKIATRQ